jgi:flagellin-like protein
MGYNKKALSPIITTVLLIVMALILAMIIFMWAVGFFREQVSKADQPIENICPEVNLQASIVGDKLLSLNNQGDYAIYKITIKVSGAGTSDKEDVQIDLQPAGSKLVDSTLQLSGSNVQIIPILLGTSKKTGAVKEYSCINSALVAEQV